MASYGMLRRVALVRTDVSEELSASIIKVRRIGEIGTLAVATNRSTLRRLIRSSETSVVTRAIRGHISEDDVHYTEFHITALQSTFSTSLQLYVYDEFCYLT
jgi:hypothetical protein